MISVNEDGSNLDWITTTVKDKDIEFTVTKLTGENRGAIVLVFSEDLWQSILTDSVAKYGTLKDALVYKESIWKPGKDSQESEIFGDNIRGEYAGNVWTNLFQEKEKSIPFRGYLFAPDMGGEYTFELLLEQGMKLGTIEPCTENLGLGTDNVYFANMSNEILTYGTVYIEVVDYKEGMSFEYEQTIPNVTIGVTDYENKKCISVVGKNKDANYSIVKIKDGDAVVAACIIQFY